MTGEQSNIVVAIDAELNVLERRVTKLRELRRLALELDEARLPRAAAATRPRAGKRTPPLQASDVIDTARDVLSDGAATVKEILRAAGREQSNSYTRLVVESALEQLGAHVIGTRGRGKLWALPPADPDTATPSEPEAPARTEEDEAEQLHAIVREILQRQVDCSDEEIQFQLRRRYGIEISLVDAKREHDLARARGGGHQETAPLMLQGQD